MLTNKIQKIDDDNIIGVKDKIFSTKYSNIEKTVLYENKIFIKERETISIILKLLIIDVKIIGKMYINIIKCNSLLKRYSENNNIFF